MNRTLTNLLMSSVLMFLVSCAGDEPKDTKANETPVVVNDQGTPTSETPANTVPAQSDQLNVETAAAPTVNANSSATTIGETTPVKKEERGTKKEEKLATEEVRTTTTSVNERTVNTPLSEKPVVEKSSGVAVKSNPVKSTKTVEKPEVIAAVEPKSAEGPSRGMAPSKTTKTGAIMKIDNPTYDFGSIHEGEEVTHTFTIRNTGTSDLTIDNAKPACGCTIPDIPLEPIGPGKVSDIKVRFNSKNKVGPQRKTIDVMTNAGVYQISLVGTVYPKEDEKLGN